MSLPGLRHNRAAAAYLFVLQGVTMGSWMARTPAIMDRVSLGDGGWGLAAVSSTVGSLLALLVVTLGVGRVSLRPFLVVGACGMAAFPFLFTLARSPLPLVVGLFAYGLAMGSLQTPMNTEAVMLERIYGRPIMVSFHASFSSGLLAGSLIAATAAHWQVSVSAQTGVVALVLLAGFALSVPALPRAERLAQRATRTRARPSRAGASAWLHRRLSRQIGLLAAIAGCSIIAEGSASTWSARYMTEYLAVSGTLGTLAYAAFATTMLAGRLSGDRFVSRFGRARVLGAGGLLAGIGLAAGLATRSVAGGIAGFALLGAGLASVVPSAFGEAGNQPGMSAGESIATVSLVSAPSFLLGPPIIGSIASASSLWAALFVPVATALTIGLLTGRIREHGIGSLEPAVPELGLTAPAPPLS
ncbi:MAG: MFS transporter [Gaiellaceae bacterium]